MAALQPPFHDLPPAGVTAERLLWAILKAVGGNTGSTYSGVTDAQLRASPLSVSDSSIGPATNATAVTPSDVTFIANCRAVYVGTTGDLAVTMGGADVVLTGVQAGSILPIVVTKVRAATTAGDIVVLY